MDKEQWTMDNGQWTKNNGQWTKNNGQWTMDKGQFDPSYRKCFFENARPEPDFRYFSNS
jgi:hypothetical protein